MEAHHGTRCQQGLNRLPLLLQLKLASSCFALRTHAQVFSAAGAQDELRRDLQRIGAKCAPL